MRDISAKAKQVWKTLGGYYGTQLHERYGAAPPAEWQDAIHRLNDEQIGRALAVTRAECVQFPPTLPQFLKAARPPMAPPRTQESTQEQLADFVARAYHGRLTAQQYSGWVYLYREVRVFDDSGKERRGAQCIGVEIPQRDGTQGYRIMVEDMQLTLGSAA